MAMTKMSHTKSAMLKDTPADIIQAVSVVPMFAPMMILMACASVSKEALTNETVITVVAVELCTAAVTPMPVSIPVKRLVVMRAKMCLSLGPAIFCNASLIVFMPKMRSANEPSRVKAIVIVMIFVYLGISRAKVRRNPQLFMKIEVTFRLQLKISWLEAHFRGFLEHELESGVVVVRDDGVPNGVFDGLLQDADFSAWLKAERFHDFLA